MYGHYTTGNDKSACTAIVAKGCLEWGEKPVRHTKNPIDKGRIAFERYYLCVSGYPVN